MEILKLFNDVNIWGQIEKKGDEYPWIILSHGVGEYSGRHRGTAEILRKKYNLFLYDLRGHGKSEGRRAYAESFDVFRKDLAAICRFLVEKEKAQEISFFGHSMGGLITADFIQNEYPKNPFPLGKIFLSSPPMGLTGLFGIAADSIPLALWQGLEGVKLSLPLKGLVNLIYLSHDKKVIEDYIKDPLVSLKIHSKLALGLVSSSKRVFSKRLGENLDLSVVVGTGDRIVSPKHIEEYISDVMPEAKLKLVEGGFHELGNEVEEYRSSFLDFLRQEFAI